MKMFRSGAVLGVLCFLLLSGCDKDEAHSREAALELVSILLTRQAQESGYGLITTVELKELLENSSPLFLVDARSEKDFRKGHIQAAENFTFPKGVAMDGDWDEVLMVGRGVEEFQAFLGPDYDRLLVFSCGRTRCERAHNAALWAVRLGYRNVLRHPGGVDAWRGKGYKLVR